MEERDTGCVEVPQVACKSRDCRNFKLHLSKERQVLGGLRHLNKPLEK